jgi:hypothetical protein
MGKGGSYLLYLREKKFKTRERVCMGEKRLCLKKLVFGTSDCGEPISLMVTESWGVTEPWKAVRGSNEEEGE